MGKFFKFGCLGIIAIIVIIIIIAIAGGGDDSSNTGEKVSSENTESTASEDSSEEEATIFKVGDTVDLNGLEITISSASYVSASEYTPAEQGKVLQMEVNVTNNKDDTIFFDSSEFNLYDQDGNSLEPYYGLDDLDIGGDINAGKKMSGTLTFDVPEADSYELIYEPTFSWSEEQVTWDIQPQ